MKVVDLFCGCGGLSLGFENAGIEIAAGYDVWDPAINTYMFNFSHPVFKIDLSDVKAASNHIRQHEPDMIIGGPPCQDFSSAGLRNEDNGRGDLTLSYAGIIKAIRPIWFIMENVSTITKTRKLAEAKDIFREAGYGMTQVILDASLCGVPQKRKRFFLIGKLGESDEFILHVLRQRLASKPMTVKDYFGDKIDVDFYYRHPRSYARRGVFSVHEPSPTIRGVNRPLPKGYTLHPNDPVNSLNGIRPLTTLERSMIQTFPESFVFSGNKSEIEQMIGNAVPVNLGSFIANCIKDYIKENQRV
ncbi:MAG: DNA cytosine methyltransferase [Muribaculaceae bacterium]|nr:DNA cytosine methyltransferase [Muribaculaceae bacterium]MDE7080316.1 DNA cytosine methyltransferase [Muribaculaceae bacterium]